MSSVSDNEEVKKSARVIDFHSHVLPSLDDGSSSTEMSVEMLRETYRQKIRKLVATPHFYPERMNLDSFLERRDEGVRKLLPYYDKDEMPSVFLGAEVAYYPSIGDGTIVRKLCIVGTDTILIEMPFSRWSNYDIDNILRLKKEQDLNVVIAHIERYMNYQKKETLPLLVENGIKIQSNGEFFLSSKREAMKLLEKGYIHILGSDMHNTTTRKQTLLSAKEEIKKKLGEEYIRILLMNTKPLLEGAVSIENLRISQS